MTWSRKQTLISGLALILIVNLVTLALVAYNRSGDPESVLHLTQRELAMPYYWGNKIENSGLALKLQWRTPRPADLTNQEHQPYAWSNYGSPGWLDKAKMASLGFDEPKPDDSGLAYYRGSEKEVFLVLELDGPAYRQVLDRSRQYAAHEDQLSSAEPDNKNLAQSAKRANDLLRNEESKSSRLFVVDAGLDAGRLRMQYPDRRHYAIVRGRVQPVFQRQFTGIISGLGIAEINVPVDFRHGFPPMPRAGETGVASHQGLFDAEVAFGKRLEPWIIALSEKVSSE